MEKDSLSLLLKGAEEFGLHLDDDQLEKFDAFAFELAKWNGKINLTSITSEKEVVVKHFIDSLSVAAFVNLQGCLLDLGSGAGFPGLPLQILRPELSVFSVDSVEKKIIFQRNLARLLSLGNFKAVHARGESLATSIEDRFEIIVSRAFSELPFFVSMAIPLLKENGFIVAMKGADGRKEGESAERKLDELGLRIARVSEFNLPFIGDRRSILTIVKK